MMMTINHIFMTVFLLSVAGTVVGSTFLALQNFLYKHSSAEFMVKICKVVIITFVVPLFYLWGIMDQSNYYLSQYDLVVLVEPGTVKDTVYNLSEHIGFADKLSLIWLIGLALYLLIYAGTYFTVRRRIRNSSKAIESGPWLANFQAICGNGSLSEIQIGLESSTWMKQIGTVGVMNKTIVVPEYLLEKLDNAEINIILRHEITHIRQNDVALKIGMFILCSLNWFNPLVYYLNETLNEWIELSCDEDMLRYADSAYRHAYVKALLKIMEEQRAHEELKWFKAVAYFQSGKKIKYVKRRMNCIMKKRAIKKAANVLALSSVFCAMACGTVLAKDLQYPVNSVLSNHLAILDEDILVDDTSIQDTDEYSFIDFDEIAIKQAAASYTDTQFELVYEDGTKELYTKDTAVERMPHSCNFVKANARTHEVKRDGSCVLIVYEAAKCTICDKLVLGDEISTHTYNVCPH